MKHVLFLISRDDKAVGGSEEVLRLVANHYLGNGDDVHVFFLKEKLGGYWESVDHPNLHLYFSSGGGKWGIFSVIRNFMSAKNIQFDYSYSCIVLENALVGIFKRLGIVRINHIVVRESTLVFRRFNGVKLLWRKLLYRVGYKPASLVICQTHKMKEDFLANIPWMQRGRLIEVVPNPVNVDSIREKEKEIVDLDKYGSYVVAAGRLIEEKGFDILIQSFASIGNPNLRLLILGEGYARKSLEMQARQLGLENRVVLCGHVPNVFPYFKQARLCVVSSRVEGFPNVLLQMMSQNDNVVSTRCFGDMDIVDGVYMCPPNDISALSESIMKCLATDNGNNRALFDAQLENVSVENFVRTVEAYCEKS